MAQDNYVQSESVEFERLISTLEEEFIYYEEKKDIIDCIRSTYARSADTISHPYYKVLFYENVLNELYDSHINLNTNTDRSYRLNSPIYIEIVDHRFIVSDVFYTQLADELPHDILQAEVVRFNGQDFTKAITHFPTSCHRKGDPVAKEWLANKIVSGIRDQPRVLGLKLKTGEVIQLDVDHIQLKQDPSLLDYHVHEGIGVIRINNSLGNERLVEEFDKSMEHLANGKALILDLRNTPDGGNTDVAEPMLSRFFSKRTGYQICESGEGRYTKYVEPRLPTYNQPVYILVGRWTGSMGEGMATGLDGTRRATVVGTKMGRLAGGMKTVKFLNNDFGYRISVEKMYQLNGELRETFIPEEYVNQSSTEGDNLLNYTLELIKRRL